MADGSSECDIDAERFLAHKAAAQGNIELLVQSVKSDPGVLEQDDGEGYKPLAHAVMMQQLAAVKRLVKMGANINSQDNKGRTGLAVAAYQGWYDGLVYLLRKGARQNITDKSGRTALHASTYGKDTRIIGALLKSITRDGVNSSDNEKMTPVLWAAFHNRPQHVQLLIDHGADIFVPDVDGKTPLHWAAQNGSNDCCRLILQHITGATFTNCKDYSGKCALHYAAAAGNADVIKLLADIESTDFESEDPDDRTPLHWAAAMGHTDCVSLLLKLGVKPNPVDADGVTPLDYSRQTGHKVCQKLLEERLGIKSSHKKEKRKKSKDHDNSRNPLEKLKGLFRKKHNDVKHSDNSVEMTSVNIRKKDSVSSVLDVPKIVLYEEDGKENTGKRKKSKKHQRVDNESSMSDYYDHRVTPSLPLPPVGSPLLPLTPKLPTQPPERRKGEQLAPLRVPKHTTGNQVLMHEKVAALRKEREGQSRTPTPPPYVGEGKSHQRHNTSPTDLLHRKAKKKLESTPWSQQNDITLSPRSKDLQKGAGKSHLSPVTSQYGQMTSMEKKTLDRTIHSLLH